MNNKGLTLVELLATLVVLGIIAAIVYSNIIDDVKDKKTEISTYQKELIKDATQSYIADYINDNNSGNCGETGNPSEFIEPVLVSTLVNQGYLSDEYLELECSVRVTCENKGNNSVYEYEIVE